MKRQRCRRYRRMLERPLIGLVLASIVLLGGCERLETLVGASAQEAPRAPESVEFAVDADGVYYATLNHNGSTTGTDRLENIPLAARVATIVHVRDQTPELDDRYYMANLLDAQPGQRHTATLRPATYIDAALELGEAGARRALDVRFVAEELLGVDEQVMEPSIASKSPGSAQRPSSAPAPRQDVIELFADSRGDQASDQGSIEIHHVNPGGSSSTKTRRGAQPSGGASWRPVTLYYANWCGVCRNARRWLDAKNVPYRGVDIDASDKNKSEMARFAKLNGARPYAVPTFRIGDDIMQGWSAKRFEKLARK